MSIRGATSQVGGFVRSLARHRATGSTTPRWSIGNWRRGLLLLGGVVLLSAIAIVLGFLAGAFPASFVAKVGVLLALFVVFLIALLAPNAAAPMPLLRKMLLALFLIWVVWPAYLAYKVGPVPGLSPTRAIYWSLVATWLFWVIASPDFRQLVVERIQQVKVLTFAFATYLGWIVVCAFASEAPLFTAYQGIKVYLGGYLIFLIVLSCIRNRQDVEKLIVAAVAAGALVSLIGFAEAIHKKNLFLRLLPSDPELLQSMDWIVLDDIRFGAYRVRSTFSHPLAFAEYLSMCLPLAAYLFFKGSVRWRRWLGLIAIPLMLAGIYMAISRSSLVAIAVVFAAMALVVGLRSAKQRRSHGQALFGWAVLFSIPFVVATVIGVVAELAHGRDRLEQASTNIRIIMFQRGFDLIAQEPILGHGPALAAYTLGRLPGNGSLTIDSYYLSVALDTGLPGLLLFVFILALPMLTGFRLAMTKAGDIGLLATALMGSILAFSVVKTVLSLTNNMDFALALIAILLVVEILAREESAAERNS